FDYIHRRDGYTDIYFVINRTNQFKSVNCSFRVVNRAPELWNPVTGERRFADAYKVSEERIVVPLEFPPYGSWFVVFREPVSKHPPVRSKNSYEYNTLIEILPPWDVVFDKKYVTNEKVVFDKLISWTQHEQPDIKYYSGAATYVKEFSVPHVDKNKKVYLDIGSLRELAEVKLNGKTAGILWAPPFRVEITSCLKPETNKLEITVVNFWPNRIIGDLNFTEEKRVTKTNIRKFTKNTPLMESGLFGTVKVLTKEE
ncbi:MAG: glycosyl hydrolase, partial [Verrucomicrobiae bacterium]|nr:glycosyl hydrolase [Verrucomicrobiae bacterium]